MAIRGLKFFWFLANDAMVYLFINEVDPFFFSFCWVVRSPYSVFSYLQN